MPHRNKRPASSIQRRLLEDRAAALEKTATHLRFYGQRTYFELVNLNFALYKIPLLSGEKIRIDFLCLAAYLWPTWQSVYEACLANERVQARVILLDRERSLLEDASCIDAGSFFKQSDVPYIHYADYAPDVDRPHILMYQLPYNSIYEQFRKVSPDLVKLRGTRPVYISYGIEYDEAHNKDATNSLHYHNYAQSLAWRAFVMHEDIREGYFLNCRTGGEHVHVLGHPRFDVYAHQAPPLPEHIEEVRRGRNMVLYNVHHPSEHDCRRAGRTHSPPVEETIAILLWLAEQADICTAISLHPLFEAWAIQKRRVTTKALEDMRKAIHQSPNVVLLTTGDYRPLLPHMDAFISDQSSLLLEMAFQNKPILYLYDEPLALKPFAEDIFSSFYHGNGSGQGLADVQAFLRRLRDGDDQLAGERQRVWSKYFSTCDGRIGQRIVKYMIAALQAEEGGTV
jgi:hypothetical protein